MNKFYYWIGKLIGQLIGSVLNLEYTRIINRFKRNRFLCQNHNDIIHNLKEIKKEFRRLGAEKKMIDLVNETIILSRECKRQGVSMENRLKLYRNSIERLGFKRK